MGVTVPECSTTDRDLLAAVGERDRGALRELFDRHQPWLAARVRQR